MRAEINICVWLGEGRANFKRKRQAMNLSQMGEKIKRLGMTAKHNCSHEEVKK
jgi:hypothetical protein